MNGMSSTALCLASISTLCCISADRYLAVVKPMRYKHVLTPRRALCMLALVWLGSLSLSCLPLITTYEYHPGTNFCSPAWHRSCGLYAFMTVFAFGVPLITLLSTYGMIFASIRRHTKRVSHWRTSTNGSNGKRDSPRVTDITGREFESFLSNSGVEEEKSNFKRVKEACTDHSVPDNSIGDLRAHVCEAESIKAKVSERHHDKKFRSHSAGCQHTRTDENLLPLFVQMKSAAKAITSDESPDEPARPRSCSVSVQFSINGLVPGTVSAFFCPADNSTDPGQLTRSVSLSYRKLHSIDPNNLISSEPHAHSAADQVPHQPSECKVNRIPSHSISLTVTTASNPVSPDLNVPSSFSINGLTPQTQDDRCIGKVHLITRRLEKSKTESNSNTSKKNSNHLQLPPVKIPVDPVYPVQLGKASLPELVPRPKSRSRSLSFGTLAERSELDSTSLKVPAANKTSSPLLRLRAISKFKSKLRVSSIPREYKIAKIGFILVLVFFLSWGPYVMVHNCQPSSETPLWVYRMAMWLVYLSCVLNPIVYALSSKHIRTAFSSHMKCCKLLHSRKSKNVRHRAVTLT